MSRKLLSAYGGAFNTDVSAETDVWLDQSGNTRNITASTSSTRPNPTTAGPNSRACLDFNGTVDIMESAALMNTFIANNSGYIIASFITDRTSSNSANIYDNDPVWCDNGGNLGVHIKNGSIVAYNFSGGVTTPTGVAISTGTAYVVEWWHTGGVLSMRVNGGTTNTVASGNTLAVNTALRIGRVRTTGTLYFDGRLFEMAVCPTVPGSTAMNALAADFKAWVGA